MTLFRLSAVVAPLAAAQTCVTESLPNPIANESHPITGTVNGTVAIVPISYDLARSIIPAQYPILKKQYQQWLPWLPEDHYPVRCRLTSTYLLSSLLFCCEIKQADNLRHCRPCSRQSWITMSTLMASRQALAPIS